MILLLEQPSRGFLLEALRQTVTGAAWCVSAKNPEGRTQPAREDEAAEFSFGRGFFSWLRPEPSSPARGSCSAAGSNPEAEGGRAKDPRAATRDIGLRFYCP